MLSSAEENRRLRLDGSLIESSEDGKTTTLSPSENDGSRG